MKALVTAAVFAAALIAEIDATRAIVWPLVLAANLGAAQLAAGWRR